MSTTSHKPTASAEPHALREALTRAGACNVFALVDGALLRNLSTRAQRRWSAKNARSLLTGGTGSGAAESGPLLFQLSPQDLEHDLPISLVDEASGHNAGSILFSRLDLYTLAARLSPFVDVELSDGATMVMRFFDPRVLPVWLDLALKVFSRHLSGTASNWLYWDDRLELNNCEIHQNDNQADEYFPLKLTANQEQQFLEECYPFTLIERFRQEDPGALASISVADRYHFFRTQIARAESNGFTGSSDIEIYCGLAIDMGPRFDENDIFSEPLLKAKAGAKLADILSSLSNDDWARLRVK
jgi:hypothetical protein